MDVRTWLKKATGGEPLNEIARRAQIPTRTLYNQIDRDTLAAENVIKVADTYSVHPIRALIDTGYVRESWASAPDIEAALREATDAQIADELLRRLGLARKHGETIDDFVRPVDEIADSDQPEPDLWNGDFRGSAGAVEGTVQDPDDLRDLG